MNEFVTVSESKTATAHEIFNTINMVVEELNRKSTDLIGDVVIEKIDGTMEIIDDYIDICEKWVECYERKENSKED